MRTLSYWLLTWLYVVMINSVAWELVTYGGQLRCWWLWLMLFGYWVMTWVASLGALWLTFDCLRPRRCCLPSAG